MKRRNLIVLICLIFVFIALLYSQVDYYSATNLRAISRFLVGSNDVTTFLRDRVVSNELTNPGYQDESISIQKLDEELQDLLLGAGSLVFSGNFIHVADTNYLKLYDTDSALAIVYLDGLSNSNTNGGGFFVKMDSTYGEGVDNGGIAYANIVDTLQWVRISFLQERETNVLWTGSVPTDTLEDSDSWQYCFNQPYNVKIPYGDYYIKGVDQWRRGQVIYGAGVGARAGEQISSTIVRPAVDCDTMLIIKNASGQDANLRSQFKDLYFYGNSSTDSAKFGIYMEDGTSYHQFYNLFFEDFHRSPDSTVTDTCYAIYNEGSFGIDFFDCQFLRNDVQIWAYNMVGTHFISTVFNNPYAYQIYLELSRVVKFMACSIEGGQHLASHHVKIKSCRGVVFSSVYGHGRSYSVDDAHLYFIIEGGPNLITFDQFYFLGKTGPGNRPSSIISVDPDIYETTITFDGCEIYEFADSMIVGLNNKNLNVNVFNTIVKRTDNTFYFIPMLIGVKTWRAGTYDYNANLVKIQKRTIVTDEIYDYLPTGILSVYDIEPAEPYVDRYANNYVLYVDSTSYGYVTLADLTGSPLDLDTLDKSIYLLFKPTNISDSLSIGIFGQDGNNVAWTFNYLESSQIRSRWKHNTPTSLDTSLLERYTMRNRNWYGIGISRTFGDSIRFYVNGEKIGAIVDFGRDHTTAYQLKIGAESSGFFDDLVYWNEAINTEAAWDTIWNGGYPINYQAYPVDHVDSLSEWFNFEADFTVNDTLYGIIDSTIMQFTGTNYSRQLSDFDIFKMFRVAGSGDADKFYVSRDGDVVVQGDLQTADDLIVSDSAAVGGNQTIGGFLDVEDSLRLGEGTFIWKLVKSGTDMLLITAADTFVIDSVRSK